MPLVRFEVRNEYGLGDPELYRGAAKREDPKALLDGVAVAGLVGILRQLGDLAEFAADVFHDLHEQVTTTAARGHKMMARIRHIEEALPSIEKAVHTQTSHIHFAYIAGSDWHANVRTACNHLLHSDLPRFIMDSYEECREPPRLYLLDKFDSAGPGACLRRYSDPTYFKRVWASSESMKAEKTQKEKKTRKSKKKSSCQRNGEGHNVVSLSRHTSSMQFASPGTDGQSIAAENMSTSDMRLKSELGSRSTSFDSRTRFSFVEPVPDINSSVGPEEPDYSELSTPKVKVSHSDTCASASTEEQNVKNAADDDDSQHNSLHEKSAMRSPSVTWDEKAEIVEPTSLLLCDTILDEKAEIVESTSLQLRDTILDDGVQNSESLPLISETTKHESETVVSGTIDDDDISFGIGNALVCFTGSNYFDEVASETDNYVDAPNTLEYETETDTEFQTKWEVTPPSNFNHQGVETGTDNMQDINAPSSESSDLERPIASHTSLSKEVPPQISNSGSLESVPSVQSLHMTDLSLPVGSVGSDSESCDPESPRINALETVNGDLSSQSTIPDLQTVLDNEITTADVHESRESPKIVDGPHIKFWTNGGLLGLEPSKPPDFIPPNFVHENYVSDAGTDGCGLSRNKAAPKLCHDASSIKSDTLLVPDETMSRNSLFEEEISAPPDSFSSSNQSSLEPHVLVGGTDNVICPVDSSIDSPICQNEQHGDGSMKNSKEYVPVFSKPELSKFQRTHSSSMFVHSNGHDVAKPDVSAPGNELLATSKNEVPPDEYGPVNVGLSSSLSGLKRRLRENSFQRKASLTLSDTPSSSGMMNIDLTILQDKPLQSDHARGPTGIQSQASHEQNPWEKLEVGSSENSISSTLHYSGHSSPPLEHMKISFHPMNGLETYKLKLEFPDSHLHENIEDLMFPSFQLLPGPTIPLQGISSESDDDTFCRSCPYSSEDILSPRSESNSEFWEQDDGSQSENHEMHDNSRRVSSTTASVSSSVEHGGMTHHGLHPTAYFGDLETEDGIVAFQSGPLLDLPILDSFKYSVCLQEGKCHSRPNDPLDSTSQCPTELPPPPPLPPLQWRMMNLSSSIENNSADIGNHSDGWQLLRSAARQHTELDVPKLQRAEGGTGHSNKEMAANSRELDEREDLLQQIRNKSFNLRRTVTPRPSLVPQPTTNVNVVAILEKANAIRQAFVGSGGDDENWSDG